MITDLAQTEAYRQMMLEAVETSRDWLEDLGYNPDDPAERDLCEWLVWHIGQG
jgi:hypothetical protein